MKRIAKFKEHFKKFTTFTIRDAKIFLDPPPGYLHLLIHNLRKSGELKRITKGVYTFNNELQHVGFAFQPFYYGLQDALSLRNLWEQETTPIVLTPRKVRTGSRKFLNNNYLVRRISRQMFYGYELIKYFDTWIPVSTIEKTLIDFVYYKEPISPEIVKEMKKHINKKTLNEYLKKAPAKTQEKVLELLKWH